MKIRKVTGKDRKKIFSTSLSSLASVWPVLTMGGYWSSGKALFLWDLLSLVSMPKKELYQLWKTKLSGDWEPHFGLLLLITVVWKASWCPSGTAAAVKPLESVGDNRCTCRQKGQECCGKQFRFPDMRPTSHQWVG